MQVHAGASTGPTTLAGQLKSLKNLPQYKNKTDEYILDAIRKTESIIEKLENGKTLTEICKDKNYPSLSVVYRKMRDDDKFHKMIMKAREVGTFTILDQIHEMLTKPQDPKYFQQTRELACIMRVG